MEDVTQMLSVPTQKVVIRANVKLDIKEMEKAAKISTNVLQTTEDAMLMQHVQTLKVATRVNVNLGIKEMERAVKM